MGTPFMSEPHCLGEDSSQGHPGHHDRITDGKLRLEQGRLALALQMGRVPRSLRDDMSSVPSFSSVRQTNKLRGLEGLAQVHTENKTQAVP